MMIKKTQENINFNAVGIKLASPERIREWSWGEVTKAETINYRTQRAERGGLFDERIFGPEKDYECYCGKYRRIRYKDIICEKCGVQVTRSIVRRERMGHIELASPVAHIWFLRGRIPSRIGLVLDLSIPDLEKVVYFAGYIITSVAERERERVMRDLEREYKAKVKSAGSDDVKDKVKQSFTEVKREIESLRPWKVLDEAVYHKYMLKYPSVFEADIGAEAVYRIFKGLDLDKLIADVQSKLGSSSSVDREKLQKRFNLIKNLKRSGVKPEWMFMTVVPVIPPALRPMVALEGGRHATSDVNDLYRRVINRNNRLKKLLEINAPEVILRNEKRILQEAVDALIDNSIRRTGGNTTQVAQKRALKSLSDSLKGKHGRFRGNLLGKRVDYSGRSVIVVGPELKLGQCGLPKHMALELFRPFVISKLLEREMAYSIRGANRLIDDGVPEVWAMLEDVIANKYVLLNRAPTLHRLGIQAFKPILVEGNAIQVHPLVCVAFNADFDGDQMAVHVPLSDEAQREAKHLMASTRNLLRPGNHEPIVNPMMDIVLGCYWMTRIIDGRSGQGCYFGTPNSAINAYDFGFVDMRAKIRVRAPEEPKYAAFTGTLFETSVGQLLFNSVFPQDYPFINAPVVRKELASIVDDLINRYGFVDVPPILDNIKKLGFRYATRSGISWGIDDVKVPDQKKGLVEEGKRQALEIENKFQDGLLSEDERYRMIIEMWQGVSNKIQSILPESLVTLGSVAHILFSAARGSISNISQMTGMKGLIINPAGRTIDFPIIPSYKEGLSPLEYFITTHGARKGLADTALQTSKAGYLTRRLVDVAQDVVILESDCREKEGRLVPRASSYISGRVLAQDVADSLSKVLFKKGHLVSKKDAGVIEKEASGEIYVRSPLTCKTVRGLCQVCYGMDPARNSLVKIGEAVGIIAAQAIGEPGTQLTMRTFHGGGIASAGGDITMGLPRVEEVFERRVPKNSAVISPCAGQVVEVESKLNEKKIVILPDVPIKSRGPAGAGRRGKSKSESAELEVPYLRTINIKKGDTVKRGQILTDGSANIVELFELGGAEAAQNYILEEIIKIYDLQGASISKKHVEIIIRQMFSRLRVKDPGGTELSSGEIVERGKFLEENKKAKSDGREPGTAENVILGITEASLTTTSFLSAASFQNTPRILIDNALRGSIDILRGLKENVIIGRLIPAGTGARSDFIEE